MWFNSGALAGSSGGATWKSYTNLGAAINYKAIVSTPFTVKYVARGDYQDNDTRITSISTDGITWSQHNVDTNEDDEIAAMAYGGGYTVAIRGGASDPSYSVWVSTNNLAWDNELFTINNITYAVRAQNIIYDGTNFIVHGSTGDIGGAVFVSADPTINTAWPKRAVGNGNSINCVEFDGVNTYFAVESETQNVIFRNQGDPIADSWDAVTLPSSRQWRQVTYGNGVWLVFALGSNTYAWSNDSGDTWTQRTLPIGYNFPNESSARVSFGLDRFHIYSNGRVLSSVDGITWARSDDTFSYQYVYDWTFSDNLGLAVVRLSTSGVNTSYLRYEVQE